MTPRAPRQPKGPPQPKPVTTDKPGLTFGELREMFLQAFDAAVVGAALRKTHGHRARAAEVLGVDPAFLRRKRRRIKANAA